MKLEIIKETDFKGDSIYFIEKDGKYVEGSASSTIESILKKFEFVKTGNTSSREVIRSEEI